MDTSDHILIRIFRIHDPCVSLGKDWPSGLRCENTGSLFINTVIGKFSGAKFDQNTKLIHDKRKGSLISMKCHFKLDAGFLEQPPCAYGSCILLKLSRVKLVLIILQTFFALRCVFATLCSRLKKNYFDV